MFSGPGSLNSRLAHRDGNFDVCTEQTPAKIASETSSVGEHTAVNCIVVGSNPAFRKQASKATKGKDLTVCGSTPPPGRDIATNRGGFQPTFTMTLASPCGIGSNSQADRRVTPRARISIQLCPEPR